MSDIDRSEVIEYAKEKRHELIEFWEDYKHENREVKYYDFIINSLETDEAYQLEYEKPEFCKADNSVLEGIKTEIESINDWDIRYAPTEDKDKRAQIVAKVKNQIISIVDKHIVDTDKMIEPTTKDDCETCIHNKGVLECDMYGCKYEPATKNDLGVDCVSRQEAIDTIRQLYLDLASQKAVIDLLKVLPSVTPQEPRKGHWLDKGWIYECSCCHESSFPFDSNGYGSIYHNFCPNCGADMRGEEV